MITSTTNQDETYWSLSYFIPTFLTLVVAYSLAMMLLRLSPPSNQKIDSLKNKKLTNWYNLTRGTASNSHDDRELLQVSNSLELLYRLFNPQRFMWPSNEALRKDREITREFQVNLKSETANLRATSRHLPHYLTIIRQLEPLLTVVVGAEVFNKHKSGHCELFANYAIAHFIAYRKRHPEAAIPAVQKVISNTLEPIPGLGLLLGLFGIISRSHAFVLVGGDGNSVALLTKAELRKYYQENKRAVLTDAWISAEGFAIQISDMLPQLDTQEKLHEYYDGDNKVIQIEADLTRGVDLRSYTSAEQLHFKEILDKLYQRILEIIPKNHEQGITEIINIAPKQKLSHIRL